MTTTAQTKNKQANQVCRTYEYKTSHNNMFCAVV